MTSCRMLLRKIVASKRRCENGRTHDDSGFTLIELIIVIVILPIIIGGIAAAVITSLNDQVGLSTKLSDSHDTGLTSNFFVRDVQSAQAITINPTSTPLCGSGTQVLGIKLQPTITTTSYVSYVTTASASSPDIVRNFCGTGSPTNSAISHDVNTATPTLTSSGSTSGLCSLSASTTLVPSFCFAKVTVQVTEKSGFTYSLTATPRQQSTNGVTPPNPPSLLLLGSGSSVINCSGSGTGSLNVNGVAAINSTSSGSISGNYTLNASNVYSQSSSPVSSGPPPVTYNSATTQPLSQGPAIPDPYADLPDPPTSGITVRTVTNSLPGPGVYMNAVSITSSQLSIPTGVYIFEQGFTIAGSPGTTVSSGPGGVMFFIGIPNAPVGTPQPAIYDVSGNGIMNLTAMTTGPYAGVTLFQSRTDSNQLSVTGNGSSSTYGGVIYAPDATVNTGGGGGLTSAGIVAAGLNCGGNADVNIGPSPASTTTTISSSPNPSLSGQSVTFTATVSAAGQFTPVGNVEFLANGTAIASCGGTGGVALSSGQASCTTTSLVGSGSPYSVTAKYLIPNSGSPWLSNFYTTSTSPPLSQTVNKAATTTSIMSSVNPSFVNQSVTYTATVSTTAPGSGTATGNVEFLDGGTAIATCGGSAGQPLSSGIATCTTSYNAVGTHTIGAQYLGSTSYSGSTSSNLTQTVASIVPQISNFTETAVNGKNPFQTFSGNSNENNGTVTVYVCVGTVTSCDSTSKTLAYTTTVFTGSSPSFSWSLNTASGDLTKGTTYTATASQLDSSGTPSSNNPSVTFKSN